MIALVIALVLVPRHVNETTDPVDHPGGVLSIVLVGALILGINFAAVPNKTTLVVGLFIVAGRGLVAFYIRQRRAANPLYDLDIAARPTFWVAGCAGIIVFGSLMGSMYIGQQFLQNVLGYSTVDAGLAILPAVFCMVLVAPRSAKLVETKGARFTLLFGYVFVLLGFLTMLLLWKEDIAYWKVGARLRLRRNRRRARRHPGLALAHRLGPGARVGHGLRHRGPAARPRRRDHAVDLRRAPDRRLRGCRGSRIAASGNNVNDQVQTELTKSFSSAADTASRTRRRSRTRSSRRRRPRSCRATSGPTWPGSSPCCSAPRSCSSCSRDATRNAAARRLPRRGRRARRARQQARRYSSTPSVIARSAARRYRPPHRPIWMNRCRLGRETCLDARDARPRERSRTRLSHQHGTKSAGEKRAERIEILEAILLAIVAVATAWSGVPDRRAGTRDQAHRYGLSNKERRRRTGPRPQRTAAPLSTRARSGSGSRRRSAGDEEAARLVRTALPAASTASPSTRWIKYRSVQQPARAGRPDPHAAVPQRRIAPEASREGRRSERPPTSKPEPKPARPATATSATPSC